MGAADGPLVRAGDAAAAGVSQPKCRAQAQQVVRDAVEGLFVWLWRWHVDRGLGEIRSGLGGRMIAPRAGRVEVSGERGTDLPGDGLAGELGGPLLVEGLDHAEDDKDGVDRLPAAGLVVEQAELCGKGIGLVDVGIHAAGVVLEEAAVLRRETGGEPLGGLAELQDALDAVVFDEVAAEDFGDLAGGDPAHHVHLPEAVLRGDVGLRGDEVVDGGG